jgi:hypothetical protein
MESIGLQLLSALPKGRSFNAEHCPDISHTALLSLRPQVDGRKLMRHADSARPHTGRNYRAFAQKTGCSSPYIHRAHLISGASVVDDGKNRCVTCCFEPMGMSRNSGLSTLSRRVWRRQLRVEGDRLPKVDHDIDFFFVCDSRVTPKVLACDHCFFSWNHMVRARTVRYLRPGSLKNSEC